MDIPSDSESDCGDISIDVFGESRQRLDVKLAIADTCKLLDTLPVSEESYMYLKRLSKNLRKVLTLERAKQKQVLDVRHNITLSAIQESEIYCEGRCLLDSTRSTEANFKAIDNERDMERSGVGVCSSTENHKSVSSTTNNNLVQGPNVDLNGSRAINTSIIHGPKHFNDLNKPDHPEYSLGPIPEISEDITTIEYSETGDDTDHSNKDNDDEDDDSIFLLKTWSLKKDGNNLYLTGIKMDRKGNILDNDFTSKKILSRPNVPSDGDEVVKTACGIYQINEGISDTENRIPATVKEIFEKANSHFPKQWRKALAIWDETEGKKQNSLKENNTEKIRNSNSSSEDTSKPKRKSLGNKKPSVKEKIAKKKNSPGNKKKKSPTAGKNGLAGKEKSAPKEKVKKPNTKTGDKVNNHSSKSKSKDVGERNDSAFSDADSSEHELIDIDGASMFEIPATSLTPNGLLASIKKTAKGRFTPPTNVFDSIYGKNTTPCSTSSILEEHDFAPKVNHLVKRMAKAKLAPPEAKVQKPSTKSSQKPNLEKVNEEDIELFDKAKRAVTSHLNANHNDDLYDGDDDDLEESDTETFNLFYDA